jgi:two-component system chemotaxis response regulator CheY
MNAMPYLRKQETRAMKALVVDDSKAIRSIISKHLKALGFEVVEADNGVDALVQLKKMGGADLALLDWNMPEMNGIEFLRKLRQEPAGAEPIVIFCTSEDSFDNITEALEAGANEYIIKPFDAPLLESKLVQAGVL